MRIIVNADGTQTEAEDLPVEVLTEEQIAQREAEQAQANLLANAERWTYENAYLSMCDQLTGSTTHAKLGFAELEAIIVAIPDAELSKTLALQLLKLNSALVYHGGTRWWDTCVWHPEITQ